MKKLVLILGILFATVVYADHEEGLRDGEVYIQKLPALCGSPENIQKYLDHKKLKPLHISLGREAMDSTGQPVYMLTYMVNEDGTESASVLTIPSNLESCILYHTFDLITELPDKGWQKQISMIH